MINEQNVSSIEEEKVARDPTPEQIARDPTPEQIYTVLDSAEDYKD